MRERDKRRFPLEMKRMREMNITHKKRREVFKVTSTSEKCIFVPMAEKRKKLTLMVTGLPLIQQDKHITMHKTFSRRFSMQKFVK